MALKDKRERFCHEYIVDFNAAQAAIRAGYAKKSAAAEGGRLLKVPEVQLKISELVNGLNTKNKIDAEELQEYITKVIRGESESEVVVVEACGDGYSTAKSFTKKPDEDQKLKAAGLAAKILNLGNPKMDINTIIPIIISGENELEE